MTPSDSTQDPKHVAAQAAAVAWEVPSEGLSAVDISSKLPSLTRFRPFMVVAPNRTRMVVAVEPGGTKLHFGEPARVGAAERDRVRMEALNALIAGEGLRLPEGLPIDELCELCRMMLIAPGGLVGTSKLLAQADPPDSADSVDTKRKSKPIDMWISRRPADGRELFTKHCQDPALSTDHSGWQLAFSFFNPSGAVESWLVRGTADRIVHASHTLALPAQTFLWPYA